MYLAKSKLRNKIQGQSMTEYIIITALVSVAAIFVVTAFGSVVKGQFGHMASQLAGSTSNSSLDSARENGTNAREEGSRRHNLAEYGAR